MQFAVFLLAGALLYAVYGRRNSRLVTPPEVLPVRCRREREPGRLAVRGRAVTAVAAERPDQEEAAAVLLPGVDPGVRGGVDDPAGLRVVDLDPAVAGRRARLDDQLDGPPPAVCRTALATSSAVSSSAVSTSSGAVPARASRTRARAIGTAAVVCGSRTRRAADEPVGAMVPGMGGRFPSPVRGGWRGSAGSPGRPASDPTEGAAPSPGHPLLTRGGLPHLLPPSGEVLRTPCSPSGEVFRTPVRGPVDRPVAHS